MLFVRLLNIQTVIELSFAIKEESAPGGVVRAKQAKGEETFLFRLFLITKSCSQFRADVNTNRRNVVLAFALKPDGERHEYKTKTKQIDFKHFLAMGKMQCHALKSKHNLSTGFQDGAALARTLKHQKCHKRPAQPST